MNVQQAELRGAELPPSLPAPDAGWVAPSVLSADAPVGPDHLGRSASAAFLAEVLTHRAAGTPFCLGVFGPPGAGKSRFVAGLLASAEMLARKAGVAEAASPFESNLVVIRVQAEAGASPARALLRQVSAALVGRYPRLITEAGEAGLDAAKLAREAGERLNAARQRLDAERRTLDSVTGQHAGLADRVLFDTAGSGVDAYARANRGRIERTLRGFGLQGDPLTGYKEAVRDASEARGETARWIGFLRAFFAYRGQAKLLVLAIALLLAAWGVGALIGNETKLIDALRDQGDKPGGVADWLQARWGLLNPIRRVLQWGAFAAVAINLVRGLRFLLPINRGMVLLREDLASRQRDLDSTLAHQTSRVGAFTREVEAAARQSEAADARLSAAAPVSSWAARFEEPAMSEQGAVNAARDVFAAIADTMKTVARHGSGDPDAPARIVVSLDGLDALPAGEAATYVQTAHMLLSRPGFVTILAADRAHLASGIADADPAFAAARLNGWVQIPHVLAGDIDDGGAWTEAGAFARALLDTEPGQIEVDVPGQLDPAQSALDRPWSDTEFAVIEALAPWAGSTPRAVKRFVNLYRIARADPHLADAASEELTTLALMLAMPSAGLLFAVSQGAGDEDVKRRLDVVTAAIGGPLDLARGKRGESTARRYSMGN